MPEQPSATSPSDIQRLYDVCNEVYGSHIDEVEVLARRITDTLIAQLAQADFPIFQSTENPEASFHSHEFRMALSRVTDILAGWFRVLLGWNVTPDGPDAQVPPEPARG